MCIRRTGTCIVQVRLALVRVQAGFIALCIVIPGMVDILFYFFRRVGIDRMHLRQVSVQNDPAWHLVVLRFPVFVHREIPIGEIVFHTTP